MSEDLKVFVEIKKTGFLGKDCLSCGKPIDRPKEELRIYCLNCYRRSDD